MKAHSAISVLAHSAISALVALLAAVLLGVLIHPAQQTQAAERSCWLEGDDVACTDALTAVRIARGLSSTSTSINSTRSPAKESGQP